MTGDLMDPVFGDIMAKKSEALSDKTLSRHTLSEEILSLKALNLKLLDEAIEAANSKRRMIGVWSPTIAAAMWYLKGSIPRFSISEVASHWIEEGLERDYPELVQKIREGMKRIMNDCQLTQSISQLSLEPGEEEIKRKGWWQFWRME